MKLNHLIKRARDAFSILFKNDSYILMSLNKKQLRDMFTEETFDADMSFCKLQEYNALYIIKSAADSIDELYLKTLEIEFTENARQLSSK